jgi:hypothetical protein
MNGMLIMEQIIGQAPPSDTSQILNLIMVILFLIFLVWGQRLQASVILKDIEYALARLRLIRDEARKTVIERIKSVGKLEGDPSKEVDRYLEYVFIEPVSLDPAGLVWKLDHLLKVAENRARSEAQSLIPQASEVQRQNILNVLEVAQSLNMLYKIIRHYYIMGKKTASYFIIIQLQAILPEVMMQANALLAALHAFSYGHVIGDGAGEIVAARFAQGAEGELIAQDTVVVDVPFNERVISIVKSRGPGGVVGMPGDAVMKLLERDRYDLVIMVDAGLKLEGEKSGDIFEGVGAAIGGIGTEKYKIEEAVTKKGMPLYGVIIKMSLIEALSPITKDILSGVERAFDRVKEIIMEKTAPGARVLLVGVGNTIGIK